jgi:hypothetical protein
MPRGTKVMSERDAAARLAAIVALGFGATAARAANFDYQVSAGAAHSDNVTRVDTNEQDEDIASAGLRFSFDEKTRKITADLVGNFDYQKFLNDTYDSQLVGNFVGNLALAFVPERFTWNFSDNFGQVLADPLLPSTPLNSENINFFSTGPDLTFSFGQQNRLRLGARYLLTDYEDSPFDSTTTLGEFSIGRNFSSVNSLSLNARLQQVDFENSQLGADYDQTDAFLRYEADGARTKLTIDAGYTELDRDVRDDSDSELLRLSVARQLSRSSNLALLAGREFANSGSAFASFQGNGPITLDPTAGRQTPEPFLHDYASLAWYFQRNQTTFSLRAGQDEQDYEIIDTLDQKLTTYGAAYRRDLSAATNVQLDAERTRGKFSVGGAQYTDTGGGVAFNWGVTRNVNVTISYRYADRNGDALTGNYTENRFWLSIGYKRGAPRMELLRPQFAGEAQRY